VFSWSEQLLKSSITTSIGYQDLAWSIYAKINAQDGTVKPYYIDTNYYGNCNRWPFSYLSGADHSESLLGSCSPIWYNVNTVTIWWAIAGVKNYQNFWEFYNSLNLTDCRMNINGLIAPSPW
jgi:hypothetical protein